MRAAERAAADTLTDLDRFGRPMIVVDVSRFQSAGLVEVTVACTVSPRAIGPIDRAEQLLQATASASIHPGLARADGPATRRRAVAARRDPAASAVGRLDAPEEVDDMAELWGDETRKAVANFPVSGEPIPARVIHWLGRIKAAAARVNAELGLLDADLAARSRPLPTRWRPATTTTSSPSTCSRRDRGRRRT